MRIFLKVLKKILFFLENKGMLNFISDDQYLKIFYRIKLGKKLDLDSPKTYNEKIQWLKLNDRKDIYTTMVDKYEVKKYVSDLIGEEYIIPTLGVWDNFDDIDFESLPNQFVLKCTHDSGGIVICSDKTNFDKKSAKKTINKSLKKNYFYHGREWPYKNVRPRIIVEEFIQNNKGEELNDYKFFSFNGKVKSMFIASERFSNEETKFDFFDEKFNFLPFTNGHPNSKEPPKKPNGLEKMIELAEKLSANLPHSRIDLYEVDNKIYFGEITFFHWSGFVPFEPEEWDDIFGSWISLDGIDDRGKTR